MFLVVYGWQDSYFSIYTITQPLNIFGFVWLAKISVLSIPYYTTPENPCFFRMPEVVLEKQKPC